MKKILILLVTILMILSVVPKQISAAGFPDVPSSHRFYQDVMYLLNKGVITSSNRFGIEDYVTREEVAVMVSKSIGLSGTQTTTPFKDVPSTSKSSGYINSAVNAGVISGFPDGTYRPKEIVTRGQMAIFLARAFKLTTEKNVNFKDMSTKVSSYKQVRQILAVNITSGFPDNTFRPSEKLKRGQIAAFLSRAMQIGEPTAKQMSVHFIDVGQGDSILIQSPNGENILVDGGPKTSGAKVVAFLKSKGVKKLDYVVATHPDADHIGGLISVLNNFPVTNFVNSGKVHTTQTYSELLTLVDNKNIAYIMPEKAEILIGNWSSDFYLQVLYVDSFASENNEASIVLKTGYKEVDFLLMADAGIDIEEYLTYTYDDISADVLKAGHHGSDTSSSAKFIAEVKPSTTILSYGKDNSYGHPHSEVVTRLKAIGSKIYNTVDYCDITVSTNGNGHAVSNTCAPSVTPTPSPSPTPIPAPTPPVVGPPPPPPVQTMFENCTEMRKVYPNGVNSSHPAYAPKHDRDKDGWACEK